MVEVTGARTEDLTFHSGPGLRLSARLYLPDAESDRRTGIVFCHGFGGVKDGTPVGLSNLLARHGYTVLTFDYRGFGGSEGRANHLVPAEQVEDTVNAIEFLALRPGIDPRNIGIYGTSFGGGIAISAANQSERLRAAFITVPVVSGNGWLRSVHRFHEYRAMKDRALRAIANKTVSGEMEMVDRFDIVPPDPHSRARHTTRQPFTLETFHHVSRHEPVEEAHKVAIPVGLIGIRGDILVPVEQTTDLYDRLRCEKQIFLFDEGNHHSVYGELLPRVAQRAIAWFDRHLCGAQHTADG
jgi:cephalosporin-C deacetylase-like acetyl esterase